MSGNHCAQAAQLSSSDNAGGVLVKFRQRGVLRFLSHAETLRVFQRALVRGGIEVQYTQGFNPRPRMSLPLPRSVGVDSDDDLLCFRLSKSTAPVAADELKARLCRQLPNDIEIFSVDFTGPYVLFQACQATYILEISPSFLKEISNGLQADIENLLASESLEMNRRVGARPPKSKKVDVRPFLVSIELQPGQIVVKCKITTAGTIRVDEILKLLKLKTEHLAVAIRRTDVQWKKN